MLSHFYWTYSGAGATIDIALLKKERGPRLECRSLRRKIFPGAQRREADAMIEPVSRTEHPVFTVLFILAAAAVNIGSACLLRLFNVPLYFDSWCTFTIAALFGLWPSLSVAVLTNTVLSLLGFRRWPLMLCHVLTALGAWAVFRRGRSRGLTAFLWAGLLSAVSNGIVGSILSYHIYSGLTKVNQIDNLVLAVQSACQNLSLSVYIGGIISNIGDKGLSAVLAWGLWLPCAAFFRKQAPACAHN